jgi:hypothetical protein
MLSNRKTELIQLPLVDGAELPHPERAILVFPGGGTMDFGVLCYRVRGEFRKYKRGEHAAGEIPVDIKSLDRNRIPAIREVIVHISNLLSHDGNRPATANTNALAIRSFFNHCQGIGDFNFLNIIDAKDALMRYSSYLRGRVSDNSFSPNTAALHQRYALAALAAITESDTLQQGIPIIRYDRDAFTPTIPPSGDELGRVLALCTSLFDGFTALCLENQPFPFALKVPRFLGVLDDVLRVTPLARMWCIPPHLRPIRDTLGSWGFDDETGQVSSIDAIAHRYPRRVAAQRAINIARAMMESANSHDRHDSRIRLAFHAHSAFLVLFIANTSMNSAGIRELPWDDNYEVGSERQGFRTIKYRAGAKTISVEIQAIFLPSFKKFLKLRKFILGDRHFQWLFIAKGRSVRQNFKQLDANGSWLDQMYHHVLWWAPDLPRLGVRKLRAAKSDWALRHDSPSVAAVLLQNSEETILRSYAEGSPTIQEDEFAILFDRVKSVVVDAGQDDSGVDIPVGKCRSHGKPVKIERAAVEADCSTPEGCLFCDKYKIHADERDVRKILSCRYCIQQTSHLADDEEHFETIFKPIFSRIKSILDEIEGRLPGVVGKVAMEVEGGDLDPYWARKLEMIIELGLVI